MRRPLLATEQEDPPWLVRAIAPAGLSIFSCSFFLTFISCRARAPHSNNCHRADIHQHNFRDCARGDPGQTATGATIRTGMAAISSACHDLSNRATDLGSCNLGGEALHGTICRLTAINRAPPKAAFARKASRMNLHSVVAVAHRRSLATHRGGRVLRQQYPSDECCHAKSCGGGRCTPSIAPADPSNTSRYPAKLSLGNSGKKIR